MLIADSANPENGISERALIRLQDALHPELFLLFFRLCRLCVDSSLSRLFHIPMESEIRKQERLAVAGIIVTQPPALAFPANGHVHFRF